VTENRAAGWFGRSRDGLAKKAAKSIYKTRRYDLLTATARFDDGRLPSYLEGIPP
jgi:hypothetical protein